MINRNATLKADKKRLSKMDAQLKESEALFRTIFYQAPLGIFISQEFKNSSQIPTLNPMFEHITGRTEEEWKTIDWTMVTHPDDVQEDLNQFEKLRSQEIDGYSLEKRYLKPDGSYSWVNMVITRLKIDESNTQSYLCIIQDINSRKRVEEALKESERSKAVLLSHLPGMAYRCKYDRQWTMVFLSDGCMELTGYKPEQLLGNKDLSFDEMIAPEYRDILWKEWERRLAFKTPFKYEYEITTATGERKWVMELAQGIFDDDGNVEALEGMVIDITEKVVREERIKYISAHDLMTGLYNRWYFDKEKTRLDSLEESLPLSIIVANINGIRLINDAFGYNEGDQIICGVSKILQNSCRQKDILARTGGDEFSILMPNTTSEEVHRVRHIIQKACHIFNEKINNLSYDISLSIGHSTKTSVTGSLDQEVKAAEEYMYKSKLLNQNSSHSSIVSSIMATLYARSQETEEHAERIAAIATDIGKRLLLPQEKLDELKLFAMLHDIGKIGIDDRILNKPGKLNDQEWEIMKTHPEIGHRIAMASTELQSIAEYILTHHERWDGKGYPKGLKGEEIPLLSRILSVADAFDAMTEDRIYRKAMSEDIAIEEIMKNAETQFDPHVAQVFFESMKEIGEAKKKGLTKTVDLV